MELIFRVRSFVPPIGAPSETVGGVDAGTPRVETTAFACPANPVANISSRRIKLNVCTHTDRVLCTKYLYSYMYVYIVHIKYSIIINKALNTIKTN